MLTYLRPDWMHARISACCSRCLSAEAAQFEQICDLDLVVGQPPGITWNRKSVATARLHAAYVKSAQSAGHHRPRTGLLARMR
jgi:hypothetical protein